MKKKSVDVDHVHAVFIFSFNGRYLVFIMSVSLFMLSDCHARVGVLFKCEGCDRRRKKEPRI